MQQHLRTYVSWLAWPGLMIVSLAATTFGALHDMLFIAFNLTYFALAVTLLLLERWLPHERDWQASDGELLNDIFHTLMNKGTVQSLFVFSAAIGLAEFITPMSEPATGLVTGLWPREWWLPAQVVLGVVIGEFALYWGHRIAHEWLPLWHFHAIHHSVKKLWVVNTGRFHFIDSLKSIIPSTALLLIIGAPMEVLTWFSVVTAFIGLLTHCNVEMRFGWLSYVFNTPALHRWHHSMDLREGNKNYGENIMLWDWLFGTYFNESHRRPPALIGIKDEMPQGFRQQLAWPFKKAFVRSKAS